LRDSWPSPELDTKIEGEVRAAVHARLKYNNFGFKCKGTRWQQVEDKSLVIQSSMQETPDREPAGAGEGGIVDVEDPKALRAYLWRRHLVPPGEEPEIHKLEGGVSNRTVVVSSPSRPPMVVKQALPKLRVAVDWYSPPDRSHREALGLEWLRRFAPPDSIPPLLFEDRAAHLIGMACVPEPHENWKSILLRGEVNREAIEQFARMLATIHRNSWQARSVVASIFEDRSFFATLRLEPYYRYSAEQIPESRPFYQSLIEATLATRLTLVHGDYSPKNVLVHDGRLFLIDHEVIHFGDPAFDVGFALTHLLSKAHHLANHRMAFIEGAGAFVVRYLEAIGEVEWREAAEPRAVRHTLGCMIARVVGRSPLEYLTPRERQNQLRVALALTTEPPRSLEGLISAFSEALPCL
jgi:5-methylthioribose kinase